MIYLEEIPEKKHHSKYKWVKSDIIDFMIGIKIYSNIFENFDPAPECDQSDESPAINQISE